MHLLVKSAGELKIGFWDFKFDLVLHVSRKFHSVSMIRWKIMVGLSDMGLKFHEILQKSTKTEIVVSWVKLPQLTSNLVSS